MRDSSYQPYFPREYFNVLWKVKVLWKVNSLFKNGLLKSQCHQWHCPKLFTLFIYFSSSLWCLGFPGGSDSTESSHNAGDLGLIPGLGRSPGGGHGNPLQYSCLESPHRQRSLVGYSPWGSQGVGYDWAQNGTQEFENWLRAFSILLLKYCII